jgi:Transposase IS66 family
MDYMLKRWAAFTCFLDDGRICLTNNAAERELRGIALGRKSWLETTNTQRFEEDSWLSKQDSNQD